MYSAADLISAVQNLKSVKTTTKDGSNILMPFLDIFESFLNGIEQRFAEQKNEFLELAKAKDSRIQELNETIAKQKNDINSVEDELDRQCQYTRRETLVFSGDSIPAGENGEDCATEICELVNQKLGEDMQLTPASISIAHRLGKKPVAPSPDRRSIIVRFCRRKTKYSILNAARTIKPENLYINESLTPTRQKITHALRRAKVLNPRILAGYRTSDGSITALIKPPNPDAPISHVNVDTMAKLEKFCQDNFNRPAAYFLKPRPATGTTQ